MKSIFRLTGSTASMATLIRNIFYEKIFLMPLKQSHYTSQVYVKVNGIVPTIIA